MSSELQKIFELKKEVKYPPDNHDFAKNSDDQRPSKNFVTRLSTTLKRANKQIWFIGDVINEHYRQVSIALGDGLKTAMEIQSLTHDENLN